MEMNPGQLWQRITAVFLVTTSIVVAQLWQNGFVHGAFVLLSGIFSFLFVLLSFPALYDKWMVFAEWLKGWVIRLLFSIIYLLVFPFLQFLRYKDRLGLHHKEGASFWVERRSTQDDTIDELQRMG